ncbi:hypothetical protein K443DRAFT_682337, partial [Laccaria amethystina LaAM-08-1]
TKRDVGGRRLIQIRDGDEGLLGSAKTVRRVTTAGNQQSGKVDEQRRLPTKHGVNEQIRVTIVAEVVTRHQLN